MMPAEILTSLGELRQIARALPSQGGAEIGAYLERYAADVPQVSAIVEVGSWLGAGTAHLALGAMQSGAAIYVYDRFFCANDEERDKAARFGVKLKVGEDTLPRVMESLEPFHAPIHYIKGSVKESTFHWDKGAIGLYVDDLTKTDPIWLPVIKRVRPQFIPGKTILVLMDFHFDETAGDKYGAQKRYMAANKKHFEQLEDRIGGTTTAVFRYLGESK